MGDLSANCTGLLLRDNQFGVIQSQGEALARKPMHLQVGYFTAEDSR
jgi:hypothetical protein